MKSNMKSDWDYCGLAAECYDLWWPEGSRTDEPFYRRRIAEVKGSVLEIACGTGRLLLPLLRSGIDIEGVDCAKPMLDLCRAKAKREGLKPKLHQQYMQSLKLEKKYGTIFVPFNSFMALKERDEALQALRGFHKQLNKGGQLLVSLFVPNYEVTARQKGQFQSEGPFERADGSKIYIYDACTNNLVEQLKDVTFRYEVYRKAELVQTQQYQFVMRWYFAYEFKLLLEKAGFGDIAIFGDDSDETLRDGHNVMTFRAMK